MSALAISPERVWGARARRWALLFMAAMLTGALISLVRTDGSGGARVDFRVFWAAARFALEGNAIGGFDRAAMNDIIIATNDTWLPWLHPPSFLVVLLPFGLLPFPAAWALFCAVSLLSLAVAARAYLPPDESDDWRLALAAPALVPCLVIGQLSVLWLALLIAALAAAKRGRPALSGILIGCLTIKPQLGLLIPVALIAAGAWRTFAAAAATTLVLAILPTLWTGAGYWHAMAETGAAHVERIVTGAGGFHLLVSGFSFARWLGLAATPAFAVQGVVLVVCAAMLIVAWRGKNDDLRGGALLVAAVHATPYLWYFDTAFLALAAILMARSGYFGHSAAERAILLAMWIGAGPLLLTEMVMPDTILPRLYLTALMLSAFAAMAACLLRARRSPDRIDPNLTGRPT